MPVIPIHLGDSLIAVAMDIDGNGWSSRLFRLLLSGSVILKSTVYPEFFTGNLIPWYHYVVSTSHYRKVSSA